MFDGRPYFAHDIVNASDFLNRAFFTALAVRHLLLRNGIRWYFILKHKAARGIKQLAAKNFLCDKFLCGFWLAANWGLCALKLRLLTNHGFDQSTGCVWNADITIAVLFSYRPAYSKRWARTKASFGWEATYRESLHLRQRHAVSTVIYQEKRNLESPGMRKKKSANY